MTTCTKLVGYPQAAVVQADRQALPQFSPGGLVLEPRGETGADQVELGTLGSTSPRGFFVLRVAVPRDLCTRQVLCAGSPRQSSRKVSRVGDFEQVVGALGGVGGDRGGLEGGDSLAAVWKA